MKRTTARRPLTYAAAGVSLDRADEVVKRLARHVPGIGGFGGVFPLHLDGYRRPVLVASADGVGSKALLAAHAGRHESIGIDLVAMNANDVLCHGARPLLFLDYVATGRIDADVLEALVRGMAEGCRRAGCRLLGGETAEMPDVYKRGEYDLAGFCVGVAEKGRLLGPARVRVGDALVGLASDGLHANGFTLARKILHGAWDQRLGRTTVLDAALKPTRIYVGPVLGLLERTDVHAAAHVTGGGIAGNLVRVLPRGAGAVLDPAAWDEPAIFGLLRRRGRVTEAEMRRTFNLGLGMILVVPHRQADEAARYLRGCGERASVVGRVVKGRGVRWAGSGGASRSTGPLPPRSARRDGGRVSHDTEVIE